MCPPEVSRNAHKDTFRRARNWKSRRYFHPRGSVDFQLTPCEEASQQGTGLHHGPCSPERPRNIISSWELLSPAGRHVDNCFHLGENPMNVAPLQRSGCLVRASSPKLSTLNSNPGPMLQKGQSPTEGQRRAVRPVDASSFLYWRGSCLI